MSPVAPLEPAMGLHKPVMPGPSGTSRCHGATCGRSITSLAAIVTVAAVSPADSAFTAITPGAFADWTSAMQYPQNALRTVPRSDS